MKPGGEYASRKGAGDIKRQGKMDPYAYVPLQPKMMNRRNARKSKEQYKALINANAAAKDQRRAQALQRTRKGASSVSKKRR